MAYTRTLAQLRNDIRELTDTKEASGIYTSSWLTDSALNSFINQALGDVCSLMTQTGLSHRETEQSITASGTVTRYSLADDFYAPLFADCETSTDKWTEITQIHLHERNRYQYQSGTYPAAFRIVNRTHVDFLPAPAAGVSIRLFYVPAPPVLEDDSDSFDFGQVFDELVLVEAAIKVLQKAEDSTTALERRKAELMERIEKDVDQLSMTQGIRILNRNDENRWTEDDFRYWAWDGDRYY